MKKVGTMGKFVAIFSVIGAIGYLMILFAGSGVTLVYIGMILGTLAGLPIAYYGILFIMNICGYNEMIGLPRMDGSSAILSNFATKFGGALGSWITGIMLMIGGYVSAEGAAEQSASALMMIRIDQSVVPAVCLVIIAICAMAFSRLEPQVEAFEAKKKAAQAANEA